MLSLRHQFFLIDDAKVRQLFMQNKFFNELFAHTDPILDLGQRKSSILDFGQGCQPEYAQEYAQDKEKANNFKMHSLFSDNLFTFAP